MNNHEEREHALLSASSAARWLNCPPSAVAAEAYPDQGTTFTQEGTLAHEVAEWVASGTSKNTPLPKGQDDGVTAEMVECAQGYRDYIQELTTTPGAVVLLEQRVDYSPWVPDGFGTCDCILIQDNLLTIIDYKYGVGVPVIAEVSPQMRLYALGALNDFGIAYDVTRVEMHIYQPRLNNVNSCSLMVEDLLEWGEKYVKPIAAKAAKGKGNYNTGVWCRFCPHAGRCRKLTQTCTEYVETHSLRVAVPVLAPHEVAEVLQMKPLVELWLRKVEGQALDTMLDGGEVPGFKVVEGKLCNRKWTDELHVLETLQMTGYSKEDITETKLLSPAAMDKALGKKKVAELLTDFIDRAPGKPTIVPASDSRPAFNRADDFENLD